MIRKRLAGLYIAVFMMGSLLAQNESGTSAISMTLDDAVAFAWANTNSIKNASINIADAEQQIAQRLATGLPSINGSASFNRYIDVPVQVLPEQFVQLIQALNPGEEVSSEATFLLKNNFTAGLNLDALIFDGSYFTALKASKRYRSYVQEEMLVEKQNLRYQVIDAYLPVLLIDENLKILELNLENLDKLLFESEQLYKEGFVEQLDVDRLALSKANLQIERENLLNQRAGAINLLKLVLNFPKEQELILTEVLTDLKTEL
ncbi:MAG: TolC family protein, partial [Saprospiraceae bacterium]|nr:TolC family protein [Saprospiraceae bacterium]